MIYIATTIENEKVDLKNPYSTEINKSYEAPADILKVIFASERKHLEYKYIDVYITEGIKFFSGIVDEQKFEVTDKGCFLTIEARSITAYLIDNEASPQTYKRPSLDIIFKRHIEPYGFKAIYGNNSNFNTTIDVVKGMSEWDVLEQFCSSCLNVFPIVNADGTVDATGNVELEKLYFSNIKNGINYNSIKTSYKRYKLISEIIVCSQYEAIYVADIKDQESINKGIKRKKFINMSTEENNTKKISVDTAENMINNSKKKAHEIIITCLGAVNARIGNRCELNDYILGKIENLKVYETEYRLNYNGEFTIITLLEE